MESPRSMEEWNEQIKKDIGETTDIAPDHPDVVEKLEALMASAVADGE